MQLTPRAVVDSPQDLQVQEGCHVVEDGTRMTPLSRAVPLVFVGYSQL